MQINHVAANGNCNTLNYHTYTSILVYMERPAMEYASVPPTYYSAVIYLGISLFHIPEHDLLSTHSELFVHRTFVIAVAQSGTMYSQFPCPLPCLTLY